jgi:hypothetical protein
MLNASILVCKSIIYCQNALPEVCNKLELRGSRKNNSWCSSLLLLLLPHGWLLCPHKLHLLLLLLPHPPCWPLLLLSSRERMKATIVRRRCLEDLNWGGGCDGLKVYRRRWRGCERGCGCQLLRTTSDALKRRGNRIE